MILVRKDAPEDTGDDSELYKKKSPMRSKKGDRRNLPRYESSWALNHQGPKETLVFFCSHGNPHPAAFISSVVALCSGHPFQIFAECFHVQIDS
jgi:hypothetical protein